MTDVLRTEESLREFITAFENGTFPISSWTHAAHLAMASSYLLDHPEEEATPLIRDGIQRYNVAQGGTNTEDSGYHETLTIFWIKIVTGCLTSRRKLPRLDAVRSVVEELGGRRDLFKEYYSFDVVKSREARARWVAPDSGGGEL